MITAGFPALVHGVRWSSHPQPGLLPYGEHASGAHRWHRRRPSHAGQLPASLFSSPCCSAHSVTICYAARRARRAHQ
ncbi:hypothetical protein AB4Z54_52880 [Streptomyces sp. MCAF7]